MKILVVEDNAQHQRAARMFFKNYPDIGVDYAWDLIEAARLLDADIYDGILCDIYVPLVSSSVTTMDEVNNAAHPMGVAIQLIARERKIPCLLVTAGYHHGSKYQLVCDFQRELKLPAIIDGLNVSGDSEAENKNWTRAWEMLKAIIEKEKQK